MSLTSQKDNKYGTIELAGDAIYLLFICYGVLIVVSQYQVRNARYSLHINERHYISLRLIKTNVGNVIQRFEETLTTQYLLRA